MGYFYKTGIDITNDKQMFNFLKNHFTYYTMNSWNGMKSIANNVKLYNLGLSGDWTVASSLLEAGEYDNINCMIDDWVYEHSYCDVYFNGRSGGYLVLKGDVLPNAVTESDTYDDYKEYCRDYYGTVKDGRSYLVEAVKLVQEFDRLCDDLRDYCDYLSTQKFEVVEMKKSVDEFNDCYADDLELLGLGCLCCTDDGIVDISEIVALRSLTEAFFRIAKRTNWKLDYLGNNKVQLVSNY